MTNKIISLLDSLDDKIDDQHCIIFKSNNRMQDIVYELEKLKRSNLPEDNKKEIYDDLADEYHNLLIDIRTAENIIKKYNVEKFNIRP